MIEPKFKIGQKVTFANPPENIEEFEQGWFGATAVDFNEVYVIEGYDIWEERGIPPKIFYKLQDFYKMTGIMFSEELLKVAE